MKHQDSFLLRDRFVPRAHEVKGKKFCSSPGDPMTLWWPLVVSGAGLIILFSVMTSAVAGDAPVSAEVIAEGKALAFDRKKGNCLACHAIADGTLAGNGGPPLLQMKVRFPDRERLRQQIWDATVNNPNTLMPPFGRHGILSDDEIDKITEYILTL